MEEFEVRIPGFRPPKQARSRDSLERIVEATRELLVARDFNRVSLADIAEAAQVSTSSLYSRFATKDALLDYVHARHCARTADEIRAFAAKLEAREPGMRETVCCAFLFAIGLTRRNVRIERAFRQLGNDNPAVRDRETRTQLRNIETFGPTINRLWPDRDDPVRRRVADAVRMFTVLLHESVDTQTMVDLSAGSDEELADRLATMALRQIGAEKV